MVLVPDDEIPELAAISVAEDTVPDASALGLMYNPGTRVQVTRYPRIGPFWSIMSGGLQLTVMFVEYVVVDARPVTMPVGLSGDVIA